jgi:hypothetical protein
VPMMYPAVCWNTRESSEDTVGAGASRTAGVHVILVFLISRAFLWVVYREWCDGGGAVKLREFGFSGFMRVPSGVVGMQSRGREGGSARRSGGAGVPRCSANCLMQADVRFRRRTVLNKDEALCRVVKGPYGGFSRARRIRCVCYEFSFRRILDDGILVCCVKISLRRRLYLFSILWCLGRLSLECIRSVETFSYSCPWTAKLPRS